MKSKEEILLQFHNYLLWAKSDKTKEKCLLNLWEVEQAMAEYATQQAAAIRAERDEYRKALEQAKSYLDSFKHEHQEGEELLYVIINTVLANYKKEIKQ